MTIRVTTSLLLRGFHLSEPRAKPSTHRLRSMNAQDIPSRSVHASHPAKSMEFLERACE